MGVIAGTHRHAQSAFRYQLAGNQRGWPDNALRSLAPEIKGIGVGVQRDAVYPDLLVDIARYDPGIETIFFQVVVQSFGRAVCEIECTGQVGIDYLFVRRQREEAFMETSDMIPCLHRDILFPVTGQRFQHPAAGEYIDPVLSPLCHPQHSSDDKAGQPCTREQKQNRKKTDMLKSRFYIFCCWKHTGIFLNETGLLKSCVY